MKTKILVLVLSIGLFATTSVVAQEKKESKNEDTALTEATFGVRGNCNMCKSTIEKAAKSVKGVSEVNWNKDTKSIQVEFNANKTNVMAVHKAIAASGYDTDKLNGDKKAYKNLPGCCKYDHSMKMSLGEASKGQKEDKHNH